MTPKNLLKGFKRPSKLVFEHDELTQNYGKFIAEPFEKGYGLTIGNSLRRVLLSSIEGSAVTAVKIEGVNHEFQSIKGVLEDLTRIILNLKKLNIKYEEELPKVLHIQKKGKMVLTGADFNGIDPEVQIMNPDLHIATLNDDANIDMEVQIERGRGYMPAEINKDNNETVGVIAVDSIFSPVKKINFKVEDTRVGQRTDYDKLILEIWTDGSVAPDDALAQAAKIIKEHMTIFINFEEEVDEEVIPVDENLEKQRLLSKSIDELDFSVRAYNTIAVLEIFTLEQLVKRTEDDLKKSKYCSEIVIKEIKSKLESLHLSMGLKD